METISRVVLTIILSSLLLPLGGVYGASTTSTMAGKIDDALGVGAHRVDVAPPPRSLPSNSWSVREAQKTISVPKNQINPRLVDPARITITPNTGIVGGGVYRAPDLSAHPVPKKADIQKISPPMQDIGKLPRNTTENNIGVTRHSVQQKINRQVRSADELDAIKKPLDVGPVKIDKFGRPSQRTVGHKAEVARNPDTGNIVSVNPTSSKKAERLLRRQRDQ